jgi:hypothetical protein
MTPSFDKKMKGGPVMRFLCKRRLLAIGKAVLLFAERAAFAFYTNIYIACAQI